MLLFIFAQAFCTFEDELYKKISDDWQCKPVRYVMQGIKYVSHPAVDACSPILSFSFGKEDIARHDFIGFAGCCVTVFSLKYLINRQRPEGEHSRLDSSFPSGHTACAFTQSVIYSHYYPKYKIPLFLYAGTVGFARIYLGKHYPTDVIAGAAIGLLTGYLITKLVKFNNK